MLLTAVNQQAAFCLLESTTSTIMPTNKTATPKEIQAQIDIAKERESLAFSKTVDAHKEYLEAQVEYYLAVRQLKQLKKQLRQLKK